MANRKTTAMFRSSGYDLFLPGVRHVPGAMYSKHKIHKIHKYKYKQIHMQIHIGKSRGHNLLLSCIRHVSLLCLANTNTYKYMQKTNTNTNPNTKTYVCKYKQDNGSGYDLFLAGVRRVPLLYTKTNTYTQKKYIY